MCRNHDFSTEMGGRATYHMSISYNNIISVTHRIKKRVLHVEFYESHTHTVDMFIRASEQQRQAYGYTAESKCVTITANVRILHLSPFTMNC